MFKPARMTRVLMGGHRARMEDVIAVLHAEKAMHLDDYKDPTGTTKIGTPLHHGDEASAKLVRVRGLLKSLDAEGTKPTAADDDTLRAAEQAVGPTLDEANKLRAAIAQADLEIAQLEPFANLDVDLGALFGLKSITGYLGSAREDPSAALSAADIPHDCTFHEGVLALGVPSEHRAAADAALAGVSFIASPVTGTGTPTRRLADLRTSKHDSERQLKHMEARMATLRDSWAGRLSALERQLSATVSQTQAPLQFAVTETTFHAEGWIPKDRANRVQNALAAKFDDAIYFEELGDDVGHAHSAAEEPPVALRNRGLAKPFEFLLGLLGRPRYNEIDPTKLMLLFFPLFFGFMVGDVVVGLAIMAFGWYLKTHFIFGIGGKSVGRALVMGGFVAVLMGAVVFGEGLGIHFVVDDEALEDGELSWESIIYGKDAVLHGEAGFPHEGFIYKHTAGEAHGISHDSGGAAGTHLNGTEGHNDTNGTAGLETLAAEGGDASSPFTFQPHGKTHLSFNGWFDLGIYSKIHDVIPLLMWSVVIGVTHIVLGLLLGFRNIAKGHGMKLAIQEKASWLGVLASVAMVAVNQVGIGPAWLTAAGIGLLVTSVVLLWMGLAATIGVGFIALFEVPGLFGNILSYTRLAAVGASKAGMAIAFSAIGFILSGDVVNGVWWTVYIFGMIVITLLAILSGGLQSLRLQFVEFFQKFYEGGGRAYEPFGRRSK